jgi:hypothetical protein
MNADRATRRAPNHAHRSPRICAILFSKTVMAMCGQVNLSKLPHPGRDGGIRDGRGPAARHKPTTTSSRFCWAVPATAARTAVQGRHGCASVTDRASIRFDQAPETADCQQKAV